MRQVILSLALAVAAIYLFVSAPPPLPEENRVPAASGQAIPTKVLLDAANLVNAAARKIYTERIVTRGQEAGLAFNEDWQSSGIEAGPLPALFLRAVADELARMQSPLGLFLGSDQPIVPSNAFKGAQTAYFEGVRADRVPRYFTLSMPDRQVALYPDIAVAPGCANCHNAHPKSPKHDWKLGDVMGAATWTYPAATTSDRQLRQGIAQVYLAVEYAYARYLTKTRGFADAPALGAGWPEKGRRVLPDTATFLAAVKEATALPILSNAVLLP